MSDVLKRRMAQGVVGSVIDLIGGTPVLQLDRLVSHMCLHGRVLLKLEYLNPGSSKKDRVALEMIRNARRDGSLTPGQTVVELTSGNTGTGLANLGLGLGENRFRAWRRAGGEDQGNVGMLFDTSGLQLDQVRDCFPRIPSPVLAL